MQKLAEHIPFNRPTITGDEKKYLEECLALRKFSGDGAFTKRATSLLVEKIHGSRALLTTSCTDALEMCALLLNIKPGDEVIMPSFTFVSTANAFVLRGAKIVFVDVDPQTMNVDPSCVEAAINKNTKAIVLVHYAGISCDMDAFVRIRKQYGIPIVEDAAQAIYAKYKDNFLGTLGDLACFSFHETKNINCGEGGALVVNNVEFFERAEILREKGTNRSRFFRGQTDKYTWMDVGSSFLMNELSAAFLLAQLERIEEITARRVSISAKYREALADLAAAGEVDLQSLPDYARPNGHLFYLKLKSEAQRARYISYTNQMNVNTVFHYIPLHSSPAGRIFSTFHGEDRFTTCESEKLVRLPLYYSMTEKEQESVIECTLDFFKKSK